jgi:hypothetical protein
MLLLHCTQKVQTWLKINKANLVDPETPVHAANAWYVNLIELERRSCLLAVNESTLFNFLLPDVGKINSQQCIALFTSWLRCVLAEEEFPEPWLDQLCADFQEVRFTKTHSRQTLGFMKELAFAYSLSLEDAGSVHTPLLPEIIKQQNRIILGHKRSYPVDAFRALCTP